MPPSIRPTLFSVCALYLLISRAKLDFSVSQETVKKLKVNCFLTRFKLVIKCENLSVMLRAFTVKTDKVLSLRFLSNSDHSTLEPGGHNP